MGVVLQRRGFADKGNLNLGWGKRGILPTVAKLNGDG